MFESTPTARADLKPGTLYAMEGERGWIYYGQVTGDKRIGFFKRRDRALVEPSEALLCYVMAVIGVAYPSITRALRSGSWKKLGRFELADQLRKSWPLVQWPVGTLNVIVSANGIEFNTRVDDPRIQDMEIIASWDAERHIPARLTADFGAEPAAPWVGGPIWRERKIKEENARRYPDAPWHRLPDDWVPFSA